MTFRPLATGSVLACVLMLPFAVSAQEITPQIDEATESPTVGEPYAATVHRDWTIICTPLQQEGLEYCQMYQLLLNSEDEPIAEITIDVLPPEEDFPIGADIVTPLGTLLQAGLGWQMGDEGDIRREPFRVCGAIGCSALLGFPEDAVQGMRMGSHANVLFVHISNPGEPARARVSLMGFTAALADLEERIQALREATAEE